MIRSDFRLFSVPNSVDGDKWQRPFRRYKPRIGFPGTKTTVTGEGFIGTASDYTVTVGSANATDINILSATSLEFTMPELAGITDNATVALSVKKSGVSLVSKTIRYRPAPVIALNQPNSFNRKIASNDKSVFFTFTITTSGLHLFNSYDPQPIWIFSITLLLLRVRQRSPQERRLIRSSKGLILRREHITYK